MPSPSHLLLWRWEGKIVTLYTMLYHAKLHSPGGAPVAPPIYPYNATNLFLKKILIFSFENK